ncbi:hypothetical protein FM037_13045 [Shewanella psychropiezotolerans]|uniref:histidine kinase n=1 Tax=Shewanella psychropiezotolerans TaxID=2593655 RepID=A0ABX5WY10_9GAMM|nr:ATP-binding protein [Shewanella psychropiezotolerans]QDO83993.1 hypothetical protein FM037_13045 [Shewanella psychropiezotolerans]
MFIAMKNLSLRDLPIAKKFALPGIVYILGILIITSTVYAFINDQRARNVLIYDVITQKNILSNLESNLAKVNEGLNQMLFFDSREFDVLLLAKAEDFQSTLVEFKYISQRHAFINDESLAEEIEPVLELMRTQLIKVVSLSFSRSLRGSGKSYQQEFILYSNQIRAFTNDALYGKSELVEALLKENVYREWLFSVLFLLEVTITALLSYFMHVLVSRQLIFPINKIKLISDEVIKRYAFNDNNALDYEMLLTRLALITSKDEVGDLARQFLVMMQTIDLGRQIESEKKQAIEHLYSTLKQTNEQVLKTKGELNLRNQELERIHEKLITSNKQLEQSAKLSSIGEMSAGIAHEINQPLGVMRLYTDCMLLVQGHPSKINDMLEKNLMQIERISKIINHLRLFSRDEQGEEREIIAVDWLIDQSLILISPELKLLSITLAVNIQNKGQFILCNQVQLLQVLTNLLNNAKDAIIELESLALPQGIGKLISINVQCRAERVLIEVSDTGVGVPSSLIRKIFQPFYTTKPVGSGTGLGLSICYGIIEQHAGTIECRSQQGCGTTFLIDLPHVLALSS